MKELENSGHLDDTLIIYSSDNGIPFANGRTNLYDSGIREPMFISSPFHTERRNQVTYSLTSLLDVVPTVLDWFDITSDVDIATNEIEMKSGLTGKSLLPLLIEGMLEIEKKLKIPSNIISKYILKLSKILVMFLLYLNVEPANYSSEVIFASHNLHEVTMYYPMRAVRTKRYKLIHNLNYKASFPIDQDFYISPTFQVSQILILFTFYLSISM